MIHVVSAKVVWIHFLCADLVDMSDPDSLYYLCHL